MKGRNPIDRLRAALRDEHRPHWAQARREQVIDDTAKSNAPFRAALAQAISDESKLIDVFLRAEQRGTPGADTVIAAARNRVTELRKQLESLATLGA